jgi:hypothetical protein
VDTVFDVIEDTVADVQIERLGAIDLEPVDACQVCGANAWVHSQRHPSTSDHEFEPQWEETYETMWSVRVNGDLAEAPGLRPWDIEIWATTSFETAVQEALRAREEVITWQNSQTLR